MPKDDLITLVEAAERTGLAVTTLRNQMKNGRIHGEKYGRDWLVLWSDVQVYIASRDRRGRYRPDVGVNTTAAPLPEGYVVPEGETAPDPTNL